MATEAHITEDSLLTPVPDGKGLTIGIAVAEWNNKITGALLQGALGVLKEKNVEKIIVFRVPGTFELTNACARLMDEHSVDAAIAIGCVVRGDTPHFDYICQGVTTGLSVLNARSAAGNKTAPIIFGVLTTNTMEQAEERAGGRLGNKGAEAAETALKMCRPHLDIF